MEATYASGLMERQPINREDVIQAYAPIVCRGPLNPYSDLNFKDSEFKKAHQLYLKWIEQQNKLAEQHPELFHRINFEKTMFYVDAGFTAPEYLEEVLNWLYGDLDDLVVKEGNVGPQTMETRQSILGAIKKIRNLLGDEID